MSESFLERWSRRKLEAKAPPEPEPSADPVPEDAPCQEEIEALPPVDSLDHDSDYTVFLRRGVPEALKLAALRKAWASDPKIAGFRGFAEYDWDFNAPGYGDLLPADDIAALCRRAFAQDEHKEEEPDSSGDPLARQAKATEGVEKLAQDEPMSAEGAQASNPPTADKNDERNAPS